MLWSVGRFVLLVTISSIYAKEETKKALIITVDELKPEESDVIISDLTIKEGSSSPKYERSESTRILQRAPADKKLDYILVNPEDLKDLKNLGVDGVTIDKPKILRYPESSSDESVESPNKYSPYSRTPDNYPVTGRNVASKYPSRPAPPLAKHPVGDSSNEKDTGQQPPYLNKGYRAYTSPDGERYRVPIYENPPKTTGSGRDYMYDINKPSSYQNPSSYTIPSKYAGSNPSAYTGYSSYTPPSNSYIGPKINSYSGYGNYLRPNYGPHLFYSPITKPLGYPQQFSHYNPIPYVADKPSSYSGPSTYDVRVLGGHHNSPMYTNVNPKPYKKYSTYKSSRPSTVVGPPSYENSKPVSYSGYSTKPSTHKKSHVYEPSKPSSVSSAPSHLNSNPTVYTDVHSYENPEPTYVKSKPKTHSSSSTYSPPSSSYSLSKPSTYSGPSTYLSPSTSHRDSSSEKIYHSGQKYASHPEDYDYPGKMHPSDDYNPSKKAPYDNEYQTYSHYNPNKSTKKGYYDSSSVKHVSYDDLPTPYKSPPEDSSYEHPDSESDEDTPHNYKSSSKSTSHDTYYRPTPKFKQYSSSPSYDKENITPYDDSYKYRSTYNSKPFDDSHSSRPRKTYDSLKTSYGTAYEPSSYEEPVDSHRKYRYPSSKVNYDSPSSYRDSHTTSPAYDDDYTDNTKHKSSHSYNSDRDDPPNYSNQNVEYGSRYPVSYRKTRHTDLKAPILSHFTLGDALNFDKHDNNHKHRITEPHSHPQNNDDSFENSDNHSVKKNYSPVRPAPLKDELYQPRYPPLPKRSKSDKSKKFYDKGEGESKESSEIYKIEPSVTATKSYDPQIHSNPYTQNTFYSFDSRGKNRVHSPSHEEIHDHHFSQTSTEETVEPTDYSKSSEVTYTKPDKIESPYEPYRSNRQKKKGQTLSKDFTKSQPEYLRIKERDSYSSPAHFIRSFSYKGKENANDSSTIVESYDSGSDEFPLKRVPGVVHRSRYSYPTVNVLKRTKGYLPYKPVYSKIIPAYDNKPFESKPSEVTEKNVTRNLPIYDLSKNTPRKKSSTAHKKYKKFSKQETKESSHDKDERSSHHAIPGDPGRDYPILKDIPYNQFSCDGKLPGFYADVDNRCQVYYQCSEEGRLQSFLCPNGTIFNQQTFVCEWWHNVDCSKSEKYFGKNNQLYKLTQSIPVTSKSKRTINVGYDLRKLENPGSYESLKKYSPRNRDFSYDESEREY